MLIVNFPIIHKITKCRLKRSFSFSSFNAFFRGIQNKYFVSFKTGTLLENKIQKILLMVIVGFPTLLDTFKDNFLFCRRESIINKIIVQIYIQIAVYISGTVFPYIMISIKCPFKQRMSATQKQRCPTEVTGSCCFDLKINRLFVIFPEIYCIPCGDLSAIQPGILFCFLESFLNGSGCITRPKRDKRCADCRNQQG